MASKALLKAITSPARVASILDTSKGRPLLALEIQRHRIGRALVYSPMDDPGDVEGLPDIPLRASTLVDNYRLHPSNNQKKKSTASAASLAATRRIPKDALEELASMIRSEDVGGVIVGWPLQGDTGKMGGPCGRVLYTLETILEASISKGYIHNHFSRRGGAAAAAAPILSCHRPLCLWTPQPVLEKASSLSEEDVWGRCAAYGKSEEEIAALQLAYQPKNFVHLASREQYAFDETAQATDLWEDFWKTHWPELYRKSKARRIRREQHNITTTSSRRRPCGNNLVTDWRDSPAACMMAAELAL